MSLPDVVLVRSVLTPGGSGPWNGMFALQRALLAMQARNPDRWQWFRITNAAIPGTIPWFWCWEERKQAQDWVAAGGKFVQGPNLLFTWSFQPRIDELERFLLDTPHSLAMFCHSQWYRDLIASQRGPLNTSPIVLWPYPIDPLPPPPAKQPKFDLLIVAKSGNRPQLVENLLARFPRSRTLFYGKFRREELFDSASHARAAAYLSDDDHGPLALAEILLAGCPTVGLARGAPFIEDGVNGRYLGAFPPVADPAHPLLAAWCDAIRSCHSIDRDFVSHSAQERFNGERIAVTVLQSLDEIRRQCDVSRSS